MADVQQIQQTVEKVRVSDPLLHYLQDILDFTRTSPHFHMGLSPRAGLAVLAAARSWACLAGRDYVVPEDVQKVLAPTTRHRLRSRDDMAEFPKKRLLDLLMEVPVP
jgi:MoxR-like ATPase